MNDNQITISIVSHQQAELVTRLLKDIEALNIDRIEIILTLNLPESLPFESADFGFPLRIVHNAQPKGFGTNHNAAFRYCTTPYFCVLNPDLQLPEDPFPILIDEFARADVGAAAPLIVDATGAHEDSARRFPTVASLVRKALTRDKRLDYGLVNSTISPDWVAGMFMLLRSDAYRTIGGFDERYFLYYEDVDLCRRLRHEGLDIRLVSSVRAVHSARRQSHRNPRYMRWHLRSMLRFLRSS